MGKRTKAVETVPHAVDPRRAAQHGSVVMRLLDEIFPLVEGFYVDLHKNPELSGAEYRTSGAVAEWLTRAGYAVETGVGGTGVVGVLDNGDGPTVMLRADMDALPLQEQTGLPYASTAQGTDADGNRVPVMHACGHDAHTACLVGAADLLAETRDQWSGRLMVVAQPAEETLSGAEAMLADGLYSRFGRPDVVLGQHLGPQPAGMVSHRAGIILGASACFRVRVFGEGGHASQPQTTVDPVVIAANIVTRLQTVVSREISPSEMAVLTVGRMQAGTKANIIPDEAVLEINIRALNASVAGRLSTAIERIVLAEAVASGAPREPEITRFQEIGVTRNDPDHTADVASAHRAYFGDGYVIDLPDPFPSSEDFGVFGLPGDPDPVPYVFWFIGATPHDVWENAAGETPYEKLASVPSNHSPFFAPAREPTLRAGLAALTVAALSYLGRDRSAEPSAHAQDTPLGIPVPGPAPEESGEGAAEDADGAIAEARAFGHGPESAAGTDAGAAQDALGTRDARDEEWGSDRIEESTLSADMGALLEEDDDLSPPFPTPPGGPAYAGPPPQGAPVSAPPPPPGEERDASGSGTDSGTEDPPEDLPPYRL